MRTVLEESVKNSGQKISLAAPTGGWNARNPLPAMKPNDAVYMDNLWPQLTNVVLRKGFKLHGSVPVTASGAVKHNIRTLLPYQPTSGSGKLFAANFEGIYNVTSGSDATADIACTNGEWQHVNMTTPGGSFLWACNGVDKPVLYSGSAWVSLDGTSTPAITGITTTDIINVTVFKNRLILLKKSSLSFYYLPLNSIAGAASEFPLGSLLNKGGYLMAALSWSIDAGEGADDYLVFITSQGELVVYKGTDPASAATFSLVGVYEIGIPIGRKCLLKVGGDVYVITVGGLLPLSKALISASVNKSIAVSDRIVEAWTAHTSLYKGLFGWQAVLYPDINMLLVNIPIKHAADTAITYSYQFVMNTITGAWARFTGQDADCWCQFGSDLFFASANKVYKAWNGYTNNELPITVNVKQAYQRFTTAPNKRVTLIKPMIRSNTALQVQLGIDTDYDDSLLSSSSTGFTVTNSQWDSAHWDSAKWGGLILSSSWRSVSHQPGNTLSLRLRCSIRNVIMEWNATDLIVEGMSGLM